MEQQIAAQVVGLGGVNDFSLWQLFLRADFVVKSVIILLISSSIYSWALIFDKYKYGNSFYLDGGLSDNFGIQMGDKLGNKVLGLLLYEELESNSQSDSEIESLDYIYKILLIPIDKATHYKITLASDNCDIIQIKSNPKKFFNFDMNFKEKMEMFCSGYNQIREL